MLSFAPIHVFCGAVLHATTTAFCKPVIEIEQCAFCKRASSASFNEGIIVAIKYCFGLRNLEVDKRIFRTCAQLANVFYVKQMLP